VDFSLPQQELARLKTGLKVTAISDSYPDQVFEGELTVISPELDAVTRSIKLRAKFANADERLRAGMFIKVSVVLPEAKPVLAIPATAIMRAPSGDSVFVITGTTNLVVQQKLIRTGRVFGFPLSGFRCAIDSPARLAEAAAAVAEGRCRISLLP